MLGSDRGDERARSGRRRRAGEPRGLGEDRERRVHGLAFSGGRGAISRRWRSLRSSPDGLWRSWRKLFRRDGRAERRVAAGEIAPSEHAWRQEGAHCDCPVEVGLRVLRGEHGNLLSFGGQCGGGLHQPVEFWVGVLEVLDGLYEPKRHRHRVAVPNLLRGIVAVAIAWRCIGLRCSGGPRRRLAERPFGRHVAGAS